MGYVSQEIGSPGNFYFGEKIEHALIVNADTTEINSGANFKFVYEVGTILLLIYDRYLFLYVA